MRGFTIIGDPDLNRTQLFAQAAEKAGATVSVISYARALSSPDGYRDSFADRYIRIESPGRNFSTEVALLRRGLGLVEPGYSHYTPEQLEGMQRDPGLLFGSRQWYLGWTNFLEELAQYGSASGSSFLNCPAEIATLFDKPACHHRLRQAGVSVPTSLPCPRDFDELVSLLNEHSLNRVFLKPAHGSAGSGVVALSRQSGRFIATTAVEMNGSGDGSRLYSTRKLRSYSTLDDIRGVVSALCRERLHVEAWVPKAGLDSASFDVRVVTIKGRACHLVLRLARGPITNLHLNAHKGTEDMLRSRAGDECVQRVRRLAEQTALSFPGCLTLGIDIAVTPSFMRAVVLEVNAFGDLLEGVSWRGADTYTWEIRAALGRSWPPD